MKDPELFDPPPFQGPTFDGATIAFHRDHDRLSSAMARVNALMRDGQWRTLKSIALLCDCSEAGASARLRDHRKPKWWPKYGLWKVERRNVSGGTWEYKLSKP